VSDQELERRLILNGRLLDALYGPHDKTYRQNLEDLKRELEEQDATVSEYRR
jgi:hypothetical protein